MSVMIFSDDDGVHSSSDISIDSVSKTSSFSTHSPSMELMTTAAKVTTTLSVATIVYRRKDGSE